MLSPRIQTQGFQVVLGGKVAVVLVRVADAHVDPRSHVVGLELESLAIGLDGNLAAIDAVAVCLCGAELVPVRVVGWIDLERALEGSLGQIEVGRDIVQHSQRRPDVWIARVELRGSREHVDH